MSASGPDRRFAAAQRHGCCQGKTGRSADLSDTATPDPEVRQGVNERIAKGSFAFGLACLVQVVSAMGLVTLAPSLKLHDTAIEREEAIAFRMLEIFHVLDFIIGLGTRGGFALASDDGHFCPGQNYRTGVSWAGVVLDRFQNARRHCSPLSWLV